jgi:hypothetical protein
MLLSSIAVVYNRWIFAMTPGQVVAQLQADVVGSRRINGWSLSMASWNPKKVKSKSGVSQMPKAGFTPGFDDAVGSTPNLHDYKIQVDGVLKIWQAVQYETGTDLVNSDKDARNQRGAVIDAISRTPRLAINWFDFEHDELKFPTIALVPSPGTELHIAQGVLPFTFTYVVTATD